MKRNQQLIIAGMLSVLGMLLLSFVILLATVFQDNGSSSPNATLAPTHTPVKPTPVPILHVAPSQGWVKISKLPFAKTIAFSANNPLSGYACGNLAQTEEQIPLELSMTRDGGKTWQTPHVLPIKGATCVLSVNPVNPRDLLIAAPACIAACLDGDETIAYLNLWYRSQDGGTTWNPIAIPPDDNSVIKQGYIFVPNFVWAGSTLIMHLHAFSQMGFAPHMPYNYAISTNGAPFTWMDTPAFYIALGNNSLLSIQSEFAWKNTLLLYYAPAGYGSNHQPTVPMAIAQSTDAGQTWTHFTPQFPTSAAPLGFSIAGASNSTLYGTYYDLSSRSSIPLSSTDGGHTWTTMPVPFPAMVNFYVGNFAVAPDGTLFIVAGVNTGNISVYRLDANGSAWQPIAKLGGTILSFQGFATVSFDTHGHPNAIWGTIATSKTSTQFFPDTYGVDYHAAVVGS